MEKVSGGFAKSFEELWIWQQARVMVRQIYLDFGRATPGERDFGFRDQVQRAAVSVMNNIAEGFERSSRSEFARFLDFAKGSCGEIRSMYFIAEDLEYADLATAQERRAHVARICAGIVALRRHLTE